MAEPRRPLVELLQGQRSARGQSASLDRFKQALHPSFGVGSRLASNRRTRRLELAELARLLHSGSIVPMRVLEPLRPGKSVTTIAADYLK